MHWQSPSTNHHGHGILLLILWLLEHGRQWWTKWWIVSAELAPLFQNWFRDVFFFGDILQQGPPYIPWSPVIVNPWDWIRNKKHPIRQRLGKTNASLWVIWGLGLYFRGRFFRSADLNERLKVLKKTPSSFALPVARRYPNRSDCGRKYTAILRESHWCWDVEFIPIFCDVLFMFSFLCSHFMAKSSGASGSN